jgi:hypothetical protein
MLLNFIYKTGIELVFPVVAKIATAYEDTHKKCQVHLIEHIEPSCYSEEKV